MTDVTSALIGPFCNRARQEYLESIDQSAVWFERFGISDSPLRVAHFLAQVLHESGGLTHTEENLWYTAPRLMAVWPRRFPTMEEAKLYAGNPQAMANRIYNGRMGNEKESDDGWTYRGRGLIQITGREMYQRIGDILEIDLVADPDLAFGALCAASVAAAIWDIKECNEAADADDLRGVTLKINGGLIGLEERERLLDRVKGALSI